MEHLTDGFIDAAVVPYLCASITGSALQRAVTNLLFVGSWEKVDGGYRVHDLMQFNPSKAEVEADRAAGKRRYQAWKKRHQNEPPTPS